MTLPLHLQAAVARAKIRNALGRDVRNLRLICDFAKVTRAPQEEVGRLTASLQGVLDSSRLAREITDCSDCVRECDEIDGLVSEIGGLCGLDL